jgi:hypothetical protein
MGARRHSALRDRFVAWMIRLLVKEHRGYRQRTPNDLEALRAVLRPGDVLLVEGSQRISEVIKYLTQSSWSHAALYVGDAIVKRGGALARDSREGFGDEADFLLVEATVEKGVTPAPLSKYVDHNLRICRPVRLRPGDLNTVLDTVIAEIGVPYNVDHIIDLLRYFFPVALLGPWRRGVLGSADKRTKDVICSSQIAMAFERVRYPVQPTVAHVDHPRAKGLRMPGWLLLGRRRTKRSLLETGVFTPADPRFITPRDFDLSPYFRVVKPVADDRSDFDYKKIHWATSEPAPPISEPAERPKAAQGPATALTRPSYSDKTG